MSQPLSGRRRQAPSAVALVAGLVDAVPGFGDCGQWRGQPVPLHRRAVELAADLAARFGGGDARFAFGDAADLPADSGGRPRLHGPLLLVHHAGRPACTRPLALSTLASAGLPSVLLAHE